MKSLTCFSSRSRGTCCAVILERLAENCRGRTTAIICTRTNAPKYILESHRLHFGSICDQNGRNFEPWLQARFKHYQSTFYLTFSLHSSFLRVFFHEAHAKAVSCPVEQSCMPLWSLKVTPLLTLSELICIIHISSPFIFIVLWDASYSVIICYSVFIPVNWGVTQKKGGVWVKLDAHLISGSLRALYKKEREKTHTYIL